MQLQTRKNELTDSDFLELIQAKETSIYRIAYGYVQNHEDAKDIVQDAVCKAYAEKNRLRDADKFYPWFYRILTNTAISFLRRSSRMVSADLEELGLSSLDDEERWNNTLLVREALNGLNSRTRTIIILKVYEDMTFPEISEITKKPVPAVKSMYYRGLKFLKERTQYHESESPYPSRYSE